MEKYRVFFANTFKNDFEEEQRMECSHHDVEDLLEEEIFNTENHPNN